MSPDRFSSGGILPIAVETLLPSPPPLQQMGPVEISANLNSTNNSSSSSSSSDQLTSSDSSYSLSSSYADEANVGLDKFMLTSELNNALSCEDIVLYDICMYVRTYTYIHRA